ncbi:SPOSA6832_04092, partial [Sporobolomyces salmonicolor]
MSASLARTVFRPASSALGSSSTASSQSACPARHFLPHSTRSAGPGPVRNANLTAHLAVAAVLVASTHYYVSHPDTLLFDHPPRSAIGWVPARHIAHREAFASPSSPPAGSSAPTSTGAFSPPSSASLPTSTPSAAARSGMQGIDLGVSGAASRSVSWS